MVKNKIFLREINKKADTKIMQMSFMIVFVFIFFAMVLLFFVSMQKGKIAGNYNVLQKETAVASIRTISNMPELNCDSQKSFCLDEDKIIVFSGMSNSYKSFWPVSSITVRKAYPKNPKNIKCPAVNCTYYEVYNSDQTDSISYGAFVSICKKIRDRGVTQEICELGRLEVGVKLVK